MKKQNFEKVFSVFKKNYRPIPLEAFGKDAYKTLVSTLLSSRTNDDVTYKASQRLFKKARDIYELNRLGQKKIEKAIYPVGFYKTKAKHLKELCESVIKNHKGIIPKKRDELLKLPGVGRKTANLVLNRAFLIPAISVDTHVHYISNLLGWVKTKTPDETENALLKILPKKYWININRLFVSIGRRYHSKTKLKEFLKKEKLII